MARWVRQHSMNLSPSVQRIPLPIGTDILHLMLVSEGLLWFWSAEPEHSDTEWQVRHFMTVGTGGRVPANSTYVGTGWYTEPGFKPTAWHLFEIKDAELLTT